MEAREEEVFVFQEVCLVQDVPDKCGRDNVLRICNETAPELLVVGLSWEIEIFDHLSW